MNSKNKLKSMLAFYILSAIEPDYAQVSNKYIREKETEEERKNRLSKAEIERYKSKGLKQFFTEIIQYGL